MRPDQVDAVIALLRLIAYLLAIDTLAFVLTWGADRLLEGRLARRTPAPPHPKDPTP